MDTQRFALGRPAPTRQVSRRDGPAHEGGKLRESSLLFIVVPVYDRPPCRATSFATAATRTSASFSSGRLKTARRSTSVLSTFAGT
jgi:hypothetical protein